LGVATWQLSIGRLGALKMLNPPNMWYPVGMPCGMMMSSIHLVDIIMSIQLPMDMTSHNFFIWTSFDELFTLLEIL
jgi:hypothetical protein